MPDFPFDYCSVDMNVMLTLFKFHPVDLHRDLWDEVERLADTRAWQVCDQVVEECRSHGMPAWFERHGTIVAEFTEEYNDYIIALQSHLYRCGRQMVDPSRTKNSADPFIIALALMLEKRDPDDLLARVSDRRCCVLTHERLKPHAVKIPNVCEMLGLEYMDLFDYIRLRRWRFAIAPADAL